MSKQDSVIRGVLCVLLLSVPAVAQQGRNVCRRAARGDHRECTSSARAAFLDARERCLPVACVEECHWLKQLCLDRTGKGVEVAACALQSNATRRNLQRAVRSGIEGVRGLQRQGAGGGIRVSRRR